MRKTNSKCHKIVLTRQLLLVFLLLTGILVSNANAFWGLSSATIEKSTLTRWKSEFIPPLQTYFDLNSLPEPKIKAVSRTKFSRILKRELARNLPTITREPLTPAISTAISNKAKALSFTLWGKYDYSERCIYLLPQNIDLFVKHRGIAQRSKEKFISQLILHELIHYYQDFKYQIAAKLSVCRDQESLDCLIAVVEGHALHVQQQISQSLGCESDFMEFNALLLTESIESGLTPHNPLVEIEKKRQRFIYGTSRKYIEYHLNQNGPAMIATIYSKPPRQIEDILAPGRTPAPETEFKNLFPVLAHIENLYARGRYECLTYQVSKLQFFNAFEILGDSVSRRMVAAIKQALSLAFVAPEGQVDAVTLIELKHKGAAAQYMAYLEQLARKNFEQAKDNPAIAIENVEILPANFAPNQISHVIFCDWIQPDKSRQSMAYVRYAIDDWIVEINNAALNVNGSDIKSIVRFIESHMRNLARANKP